MRRGNMMILTLVACAMLALVLVAGAELASVRSAARVGQIGGLQLEQLHRTALAEALEGLNASGEAVPVGRVLLSDEPASGQKRRVAVENVEERVLTLVCESTLADGGCRRHGVRIFMLRLEARFAFEKAAQALYYDTQRNVPTRWLELHAGEDIVMLCDDALSTARTFLLGDGGGCALGGSFVATHFAGDDFCVRLQTALQLAGNAVFEDDVALLGDLRCKTAWIDGTLTISEDVGLCAEVVVLGEDIPAETLARICAERIYMPHPPEEDAEHSATSAEILPLAALPAEAGPEGYCYFMLGQLE